jgi:CRISPR-associated protein Cas2
MHLIAIYDVHQKRVGKVLKVFRKYLTWIQHSVFQGDITEAKFEKLKADLGKIIDKEYDSIVFFKLRTEQAFQKEFLGKEFDPFDVII